MHPLNKAAVSTLALAFGGLVSLLPAFGTATEIEASLTRGTGDVPTDTLINENPATTTTTVRLQNMSFGSRTAITTPTSAVAATTVTGALGLDEAGATSAIRNLEIIVDRFDPVPLGITTKPGGRVAIPIVLTGGVILQNPSTLGIFANTISTIQLTARAFSTVTSPTPLSVSGTVALTTGGSSSRSLTSSGVLSRFFPENPSAPASIGGNFQVVLWADVVPTSPNPVDRTILLNAQMKAGSFVPFSESFSLSIGRVEVALDTTRLFFPITTRPAR